MPLLVESTESERGVNNTNQAAHPSTDLGDGWTLVTSKSTRLKSVAERTSISDRQSLSGRSDNSTLQGFSPTATKRFSGNRVEHKELKSKQKSRENLREGSAFASSRFAGNADYVLRQTPNSSRHFKSAELNSYLSREESPRQELFLTDQESFSHPDVKSTKLTEHAKTPDHFSHPSWNSFTESNTGRWRHSKIAIGVS